MILSPLFPLFLTCPLTIVYSRQAIPHVIMYDVIEWCGGHLEPSEGSSKAGYGRGMGG